MHYFRELIQEATQKLLNKLWSEEWITKLGTSSLKAYKVINEAKVTLECEGQTVYFPSRIRRGIAERVGRIIRGQYKRMNCYYDCLKVLELIGGETNENKVIGIVMQTYRTKKNYPNYKKIMVQQTIQMIKNWHKKLAIDFHMFNYTEVVHPKVKKFIFPFGPDDNQAIQYFREEESIWYRMKLPSITHPKSKQDWQWLEEYLPIPMKIQKKLEKSLGKQPKRPFLLAKTLKGGLIYFFLQFPWEFRKERRTKEELKKERVLAVDLGLKKLATAVVCEAREQLSKPFYLKLIGGQYQHIEHLYKNIAGVQKQLAKQKKSSSKERMEEERRRLYAKRNRLGDELAYSTTNILVQKALDWQCTKIIIEDLRSYKPPRGRRSWSRRLSEWLRGRIAHLLDYKCQEKGLVLQKVCPWNTSSHCPRCKEKGQKVLEPNNLTPNEKGRWFYCALCGFSANRDYIAALNIYRASFIDYRTIKSLKDTSPIPYMEMGTLHSTVPSGGPEMNHTNGLVAVTGYG